ncbi:MAG: hypothetical protein A2297_05245 [Elusimicrobia bacterium RIFOXYB2_FULL_48_7]|nr:MAG: hypothetical protein A2297_05245 [Elusimicrobia bacterium RIFOXYB2_FULL_48_7]
MATLKITCILVFLLVWIKAKKDLGLGLLIGSFALGVLTVRWHDALKYTAASFYSPETIDLLVTMLLIYYFIETWSATGSTAALTKNLNCVLKNSPIALILPPAIIGLIPIMGGAMISAPLVKDSIHTRNVSPAKQTFQNYWFRHLWEYTIPTYPGVVITAGLLGISYGSVFALNIPMTLSAIALGFLFGMMGMKPAECPAGEPVERNGGRKLFIALMPLLLVLALALAFKVYLPAALSASLVYMAAAYKLRPLRLWEILKKSFNINIVSIVIGIMAFKAVMQKTGIVEVMSGEFVEWKIPMLLLLFLLPFVTGFITGITQAFVGISFPLLLNYLSADHNLMTWAYVSGFMGVMLSPIHVCLVLTKEYFKASWKDVYKILLLPCLLMLAAAFIIVKLRGLVH